MHSFNADNSSARWVPRRRPYSTDAGLELGTLLALLVLLAFPLLVLLVVRVPLMVLASLVRAGSWCQLPPWAPHSHLVPGSRGCCCLAPCETPPRACLPPTAGLLEKPSVARGAVEEGPPLPAGTAGLALGALQGVPDCSWPLHPALSSLPFVLRPF